MTQEERKMDEVIHAQSATLQLINDCKEMGLNLCKVADGEPFQSMLPSCQSVLVFGSTGEQLWHRFSNYLKIHPDLLLDDHPLDRFVRLSMKHIKNQFEQNESLKAKTRWIQCSILDDEFLDFRLLAESASYGFRSHLGLLIDPEVGTWIGLRYAVFTTEKIGARATLGQHVCESCATKACVTACPANAISEQGWRKDACYDFQASSEQCHKGCVARLACPVGVLNQYPKEALMYHHNKPLGRQALIEKYHVKGEYKIADCDIMPWNAKLIR